MPRLPRRVFWLGLAASLLLHLAVFGGMDWTPPHLDATPGLRPIDVRWITTPASPEPIAAARQSSPAAPRPEPTPPVDTTTPDSLDVDAPPAGVSPLATDTTTPGADPDAGALAIGASDDAGALAGVPEPVIADTTPVAPPLNALPARIDLRYNVRYGVASGEQSLVWTRQQARYTLTSVAAATGLAGVFYRTRFVQTSEGKVTPNGLAPEVFRDQRGDKRATARFDQAAGNLLISPVGGASQSVAFDGVAQDALSLFFHLALTLQDDTRELAAPVFNGKKLRDYAYRVVGDAELDTALGRLATIHIVRSNNRDDGRFEAWFARDHHLLPVRVLRTDEKGNEAELTIAAIKATL